MTEKIRDYNVNGAMLIGVDNGYGNMILNRFLAETIWNMTESSM